MNPDVISFEDPTTPAPTNGVILYQDNHASSGGGQGVESSDLCTLPAAEHALCTAILNDFIAKDWLMH
jgi:hypothetical protein